MIKVMRGEYCDISVISPLSIFMDRFEPVQITFQDIVVTVPAKMERTFNPKSAWKDRKNDGDRKVLLGGVSGAFLPTRLTGILGPSVNHRFAFHTHTGPSGAGKTVLLNTLASLFITVIINLYR
jgi:hypothetical protein